MKLIALDVDGTLLNSNHEISQKTRRAIIKSLEEGHKVVIVSGRPTKAINHIAKELSLDKYGGLISAFNGGTIINFETGYELTNHTLDADLTKEILKESRDLDIDVLIPKNKTMISYRDNKYLDLERKILGFDTEIREDIIESIDFNPNKLLLASDKKTLDELIPVLEKKYGKKTSLVHSQDFYYEVMPKGLSKGKSLLEIAEYYNMEQKDIIAFGDQMNDKTMIEIAGVGIAMANAIEAIKEIADYITLSNDEDGVANYLEKFVLKGTYNE